MQKSLVLRSLRPWFSLFTGNRAAEERRETMGQTVQVDEHEGGVRSPVLSGLAESVRPAGSRKGQSLPVRGLSRPTWHVTCSVSTQTSLSALKDLTGPRCSSGRMETLTVRWRVKLMNPTLWTLPVTTDVCDELDLVWWDSRGLDHHQPWQLTEVFLFSWLTDALSFAG